MKYLFLTRKTILTHSPVSNAFAAIFEIFSMEMVFGVVFSLLNEFGEYSPTNSNLDDFIWNMNLYRYI